MPGAKGSKEGLNANQKKFCERLLENGYNKTEAYMFVYGVDYENANKRCQRVMKSPKIQEYVRQLQEEALVQAAITPSRIATELGDIAFNKENPNVERMKAIELLQKQFGLNRTVVDATVKTTVIDVNIEEDE